MTRMQSPSTGECACRAREWIPFLSRAAAPAKQAATARCPRDFFKNWAAGVPPKDCAKGTEGHNTAQIGGFVMLVSGSFCSPLALSTEGLNGRMRKIAATRDPVGPVRGKVGGGGQEGRPHAPQADPRLAHALGVCRRECSPFHIRRTRAAGVPFALTPTDPLIPLPEAGV